MKKFKKPSLFIECKDFLSKNELVVIINYTDLSDYTNNSLLNLKSELNSLLGNNPNIQFKLFKNSIHRIALSKLYLSNLAAMIHGPILCVGISNYPSNNSLAKFLTWIQTKKELSVVGGKFGNQLVTSLDIKILEKLDHPNIKQTVVSSLMPTISLGAQETLYSVLNPLRSIIQIVNLIGNPAK